MIRTLIIDDVESICRTVAGVLRRHSRCDTCNCARDGLRLFHKSWEEGDPYSLVCLDLMMPQVNGHQFLAALRQLEIKMKVEDGQRARVIVITSSDDRAHREKSTELGCDAFLIKPIDHNKLVQVVRQFGLIGPAA